MKRWFSRSLVVAAVAAVTTAGLVPAAHAGSVKLQAESGSVVDTSCGDDGPAGSQTGGTGTVVFLPGEGCQISFTNVTGRPVDAINFFITGQPAQMCGRFTASGSLTGTSSTLCIDGTNSSATYGTVDFPTSRTGSGTSFTITWDVTTGASYVNAFVDFLTWDDLEAEDGTIVNVNCGDGGDATGAREESGGTGTVVFLPADGCAITFNKLPTGQAPTGVNFKITGASGTICGHFVFSGAYTGTTASHCGGTFSTAGVTTLPGLGNTFTITWRVDSGTPTYCNAFVDFLTYA